MPDSLNDSIRRHLADNIWIYLIVMFLFILGISLGGDLEEKPFLVRIQGHDVHKIGDTIGMVWHEDKIHIFDSLGKRKEC